MLFVDYTIFSVTIYNFEVMKLHKLQFISQLHEFYKIFSVGIILIVPVFCKKKLRELFIIVYYFISKHDGSILTTSGHQYVC